MSGRERARPHRPRDAAAEHQCLFAARVDPRLDPRIHLSIELAAECRTGQALSRTLTMLTLTDVGPTAYTMVPAGQVGQIINRSGPVWLPILMLRTPV